MLYLRYESGKGRPCETSGSGPWSKEALRWAAYCLSPFLACSLLDRLGLESDPESQE